MKRLVLSAFILFVSLVSHAVSPITGTGTVCTGDSVLLSDATRGGVWSSSATTVATIDTAGYAVGTGTGVATISYTTGSGTATFSLTVNPTPTLSSPLTAAICDSTPFIYTPVFSIGGGISTWTRAVVTGISDPARSGTGSIFDTLINTTASPINVTYIYSFLAGGCYNTENVTLQVNPKPLLSSSLTSLPICDSNLFRYVPTSLTPGALFSWSRPAVAGLDAPPASFFGSVNENLHDTSALPISVVYTYTITANGCTNTQNIQVTVNPTPVLTSSLVLPSVCDTFITMNYLPSSSTPGAIFTWDRPAVFGIDPTTSFSPGPGGFIIETLTDVIRRAATVTYVYRLGIGRCTNINTQSVTITIDTCASLQVNTVQSPENDLTIYPNPTNGPITISGITGTANVSVVNTIGQKILTEKLSAIKQTIDLTGQPAGIYFVLITDDNGTMSRKVMVQ